jgi:hypothetical protein
VAKLQQKLKFITADFPENVSTEKLLCNNQMQNFSDRFFL